MKTRRLTDARQERYNYTSSTRNKTVAQKSTEIDVMKTQSAAAQSKSGPKTAKQGPNKSLFDMQGTLRRCRICISHLSAHPLDALISDGDQDAHRLDELEMAAFMTPTFAH